MTAGFSKYISLSVLLQALAISLLVARENAVCYSPGRVAQAAGHSVRYFLLLAATAAIPQRLPLSIPMACLLNLEMNRCCSVRKLQVPVIVGADRYQAWPVWWKNNLAASCIFWMMAFSTVACIATLILFFCPPPTLQTRYFRSAVCVSHSLP